MKRTMEWMIVAVTVALMILLKKLHLGVTHYNLFLSILIGWSLAVIVLFRFLTPKNRPKAQ